MKNYFWALISSLFSHIFLFFISSQFFEDLSFTQKSNKYLPFSISIKQNEIKKPEKVYIPQKNYKKIINKQPQKAKFLKNKELVKQEEQDSLSANTNFFYQSQNSKKRDNPILITKGHHASYPPLAKKKMLEGNIKLLLTIGTDGSVTSAKILDGPDFGLWRAAISTVMNFKFLPATDHFGHPVVSLANHTVNFRLGL